MSLKIKINLRTQVNGLFSARMRVGLGQWAVLYTRTHTHTRSRQIGHNLPPIISQSSGLLSSLSQPLMDDWYLIYSLVSMNPAHLPNYSGRVNFRVICLLLCNRKLHLFESKIKVISENDVNWLLACSIIIVDDSSSERFSPEYFSVKASYSPEWQILAQIFFKRSNRLE